MFALPSPPPLPSLFVLVDRRWGKGVGRGWQGLRIGGMGVSGDRLAVEDGRAGTDYRLVVGDEREWG